VQLYDKIIPRYPVQLALALTLVDLERFNCVVL